MCGARRITAKGAKSAKADADFNGSLWFGRIQGAVALSDSSLHSKPIAGRSHSGDSLGVLGVLGGSRNQRQHAWRWSMVDRETKPSHRWSRAPLGGGHNAGPSSRVEEFRGQLERGSDSALRTRQAASPSHRAVGGQGLQLSAHSALASPTQDSIGDSATKQPSGAHWWPPGL